MNKYLLSLLLLLPITFVVAQDNDENNEDEVEEVVVLGIKQSLKDAIDIKRSNVGIVDAITGIIKDILLITDVIVIPTFCMQNAYILKIVINNIRCRQVTYPAKHLDTKGSCADRW